MTTECYYSGCKHHSCHYSVDNGPFCDEPKCLATEDEIKIFSAERVQYLKDIGYTIERINADPSWDRYDI